MAECVRCAQTRLKKRVCCGVQHSNRRRSAFETQTGADHPSRVNGDGHSISGVVNRQLLQDRVDAEFFAHMRGLHMDVVLHRRLISRTDAGELANCALAG